MTAHLISPLLHDLPPEDEFMLMGLHLSLDEARIARMKHLSEDDFNWESLMKRAEAARVLPLLYWRFETYCPDLLPPAIRARLKTNFLKRSQISLQFTGELIQILDLFQSHQISAFPFKGPVVSQRNYGNLALRPFGDLDLMLHTEDVIRAKDLLLAEGFQPFYDVADEREAIRRGSIVHFLLLRGRTQVELHWALFPDPFFCPFDLPGFWERLETLTLGGREIPVLSPEDDFLMLCMHGAKHLWRRPLWLCDLAECLRSSDGLDWETISRRARELHCERALSLGLFMIHDLLGATIPDSLRQPVLSDAALPALAARIYQDMLEPPPAPDILFQYHFRYLMSYVRMKERWSDRARIFLYWALVPTEVERSLLRVPPAFSFLHYLVRPARITFNLLKKAFKLKQA